MVTKLIFLLVLFALIVPAQFGRGSHGRGHGDGKKPGHGHRPGHGHKHDKHSRGRYTPSENDYDDEGSDEPSEEDDDGDWLMELLDLKDECNPNPCLNNGVCEIKKGKIKCDCPRPFKGKRCQKAHKVCKRRTCGHGQCIVTSTPPFYECKCREPYQPPDCRKASTCVPNPCKNGGSCVQDGKDFDCICTEDYDGRFCQVGPDDCYEGNGQSYQGMVSETEDGYECLHWNSDFILDKGTDPFSKYEDVNGLGPHNYCRNPDGDSKPWCFIRRRNKLRWDYCDVRECPEPTANPTAAATAKPEQPTAEPGKPTAAPERPMTAPPEPMPTPTAGLEGPPTTPAPPQPSLVPTDSAVTTGQPVQKDFSTCGKPEPSQVTTRIYGGMKAIPGAHPWQVSLQFRPLGSTQEFVHSCGGVLIQSCWVLTAGHCIKKQQDMRAVVGGQNLGRDEPTEQILDVEKAILHQNYRETSEAVYNDIALLKLKKTNADFGSAHLLDAKVLLIPQDRCKSEKVYGKVLDDSMFCAGYLKGGVDSCQGDSGGPLVCKKDGVHYVYGLVSWGDSCAKENKPGVYTRLTTFQEWIESTIEANTP
ncbi:hypothetical protein AGOR_G00114870 [Albula goreensis]|uniref:trypsin n=1 Tax=Albula goreensis TaxID=1534307 RepID=A0A8T3DDP7_9TELE|nr:hypothetical protein AGOR_G00114870 [Albula goreensis]